MILDTSALVAIALAEPEAPELAEKLFANRNIKISAGSLLELFIVLERKGRPQGVERLEELLKASGTVVVPATEKQVQLGREAYRRYGMGSGHPARLNFGDCFSFALAAETGEPLLCTGEDFGKTDLVLA